MLLLSVSISLMNGLLLCHENGNILSAAYGVTSKCGTIALHISIGIAQGVMPLIGYSYGAKDHKRVHAVRRLSFLILLVFSLIFLVVVQLLPGPIVRLFINHAETIEVGSVFMRCWSWCVIGMSLFNMFNSIFQAVGKWKTSLFLAVLRLGGIFSVLCLVLDALFSVSGLMWVQAITDTATCIIAYVLCDRFKKSIAKEIEAAKEQPQVEPVSVTSNRIHAICREFGSGGRTIGKEVAAQLGIPCYDGELIEKIAAETGLAKQYVEENAGYVTGDTLAASALAGRDRDGHSVADEMWLAQKRVINDLAQQGPCVIVGRCADYILRDKADCLTAFIHASDEKRAERIVNVYGQREESPVQRLHDKDKKRKGFYKLYTGTEWGQADNYDVCLDSGKLGIEKCVTILADLYQKGA